WLTVVRLGLVALAGLLLGLLAVRLTRWLTVVGLGLPLVAIFGIWLSRLRIVALLLLVLLLERIFETLLLLFQAFVFRRLRRGISLTLGRRVILLASTRLLFGFGLIFALALLRLRRLLLIA